MVPQNWTQPTKQPRFIRPNMRVNNTYLNWSESNCNWSSETLTRFWRIHFHSFFLFSTLWLSLHLFKIFHESYLSGLHWNSRGSSHDMISKMGKQGPHWTWLQLYFRTGHTSKTTQKHSVTSAYESSAAGCVPDTSCEVWQELLLEALFSIACHASENSRQKQR